MTTSSAVADLGKRLLEASRKGNAEEVRQLMANGAPITTDWLGTSPLHLAAQYGHTVTAEVLLRAGVSRDGKTKVDKTPLHLAAQQGHFEIAQMLTKCGATVNCTDMLTMTPLHWAVEARSEGICKLLMESGARTDIKNKFGRTAVDICKSKAFENILKILLSVPIIPHENGGKRMLKNEDSFFLESKKRARTRKFPMTAGSWTVGEMQTADKEERLRAKEPRTIFSKGEIPAPDARNIKVISAEGSNLSSLVDAADIVRAKVKYPNENNNLVSTESSADWGQSNNSNTSSSEPSVLDTLATLATASTQMVTAVSDSNHQTQKVASIPNPAAVAPSYVTIPGIQGPVSIIQATPNQAGLMQQGQLASALPPGLIQLASPLAFNVLPGGRIQIGQSVIPGHPLGVPVQMPVQQSPGIPAGHLLAVSSGQNIAVVGGVPPGHIIPKPANATDTTPSRHGVVMSPVSQGITSVLTPSTITPSPQQLLSSTASTTYQSEAARHSETRTPSSANFAIQPNLFSQQHQQQQQIGLSPVAPSQLASAFQYANLSPGITPIPLVPVAGIGGIQLVPQTMLQTHLLNAVRAGIPQSPGLGAMQPQVVTPGGAYTIPMSPLNLSSILPTALSLSQLPMSQQAINSLAQQSVVTSLSVQNVATALAQQGSGAQDITGSQTQSIVLQTDSSNNSNQSTSQQQKRLNVHSIQSTSANPTSLPFSSGAQINLGTIASQPHLATMLAQQAFGAHQTISVSDLQNSMANPVAYQAVRAQSTAGTPNTTQRLAMSGDHLTVTAHSDIDSLVRRQIETEATTKSESDHRKQFSESNKENSLLTNLTIATVESRSPSLIVNSSHSPRMPISPGNFVRNEEEMRGISPSQISPTKSRSATQGIFTTSEDDHGIMGNTSQIETKSEELNGVRSSSPFNDAASQQSLSKDSSAAPMLSGDHVLPHLQQLIYKQLLQQQQQQQRAQQLQQHASRQEHSRPETSQSLSPHGDEVIKTESTSQSPLPGTHDHEEAQSHDFVNQSHGSSTAQFEEEDRSHDHHNAQSEYFWRVMEQENPSLKRQLDEDLDDDLYQDDFPKEETNDEERDVEVKNDEIEYIESEVRRPPLEEVNQRVSGKERN